MMSMRRFKLYINGMGREVNARTLSRESQMVGENGEEFQVSELLLYDAALMMDSEEQVRRLVVECRRVYQKRELKQMKLRAR